jgi:hypothetical protein
MQTNILVRLKKKTEIITIPFFKLLFSALEKLREEFKADTESLAQSEAISILSLDD